MTNHILPKRFPPVVPAIFGVGATSQNGPATSAVTPQLEGRLSIPQLTPQNSKGVAQTVQTIATNIRSIANSSLQQRSEDRKQGIGLLQGAHRFGALSQQVYSFIETARFDGRSEQDILETVGSYAKQQLLKDGKELFINAAKTTFPETSKSAIDALGLGGAAKAATAMRQSVPATSAASPLVANGVSSLAAVGGKALGWVGAAYSLYEIFKGKLNPSEGLVAGAAAGAYIGSAILPGVGTVVGGVIGGIGGYLSGMFKSGKPKDQKERDSVRKRLRQVGILDKDWNITLANGALFDMGKDGGAKLLNKDGTERHYFELDTSNPLSAQVAQLTAPLVRSLGGGKDKLMNDFVAYLTNAATSNTDSLEGAVQNLEAIYNSFGTSLRAVTV